jgi:hypothetical protein
VSEFGQTHGLSRTASARFNPSAVVVAAAAACLGTLAVTVLGWFRHTAVAFLLTGATDEHWSFARIGTELRAERARLATAPAGVRAGVHLGVGPDFYGWLGYLLLGTAVAVAIVSAAPPSRLTAAARVVAALIGIAGVAATLWALDVIRVDPGVVIHGAQRPPGYFDYLTNAGVGAWAMLAAFALVVVAATLPAHRERY